MCVRYYNSRFPFMQQCGYWMEKTDILCSVCRDIEENDYHEIVLNEARNLRGLCLINFK